MDPRQFDSLARSFAAPKSRRTLLGSLAALVGGLLGAREARAQGTQVSCGNVPCASNPGTCKAGCVCCVYTNAVGQVINSRCRPPGTCSPGTVRCRSGQTACGGNCVDISSSLAHCGACGNACSPANATGVCASGQCGLGACAAGYGNCNGLAGDGCEAAFATDPDNCGTCGNVCSVANATGACVSGQCGLGECAPGYGDCNGVAGDGCETDLAFDSDNCGACGNACTGFDTCFGGGTPGQCGCTPDCFGKCGGASDGCGGTCEGDCGGGCLACVNMACTPRVGAPCTLSGAPLAACNESGACQECGNPTGSHSPELTCADVGPFCCSRLCVDDDPYVPGQFEGICAAYPGTACDGREEPCSPGYTCVSGICQ